MEKQQIFAHGKFRESDIYFETVCKLSCPFIINRSIRIESKPTENASWALEERCKCALGLKVSLLRMLLGLWRSVASALPPSLPIITPVPQDHAPISALMTSPVAGDEQLLDSLNCFKDRNLFNAATI